MHAAKSIKGKNQIVFGKGIDNGPLDHIEA